MNSYWIASNLFNKVITCITTQITTTIARSKRIKKQKNKKLKWFKDDWQWESLV